MKVFICLLVLAASANAGVLLGEIANGGGAGGYSYGPEHVHNHQVIKVIHEQPAVPSAIIKVSHQHIEAAPQVVQVIHENHAAAPVVHHVQLIHDHSGGYALGGAGYGGDVKIIKVIQDNGHHHHHGSHGWA
ncbi:uncharacterized protein LOC129948023 [Eupeodes corollae]|uniref:uncharacterized protein LOC129948023 n=1 Tax=Eupeodes corollae TaxID=290404 RepID=UPI002493346C|nr:uncharacterized protein LOC129948023 [Eupeodes corollae]